MSKRMGRIISLAALGVAISVGAACEPRPGSDTANSEPIVKTEPATPPSDRGDQVVTGGDLAFMNDAAPGRHGGNRAGTFSRPAGGRAAR